MTAIERARALDRATYGTLLTQRERATILAALRHWQHIGMHGADPWSAIDKTEPLTETEIDHLCERIQR